MRISVKDITQLRLKLYFEKLWNNLNDKAFLRMQTTRMQLS